MNVNPLGSSDFLQSVNGRRPTNGHEQAQSSIAGDQLSTGSSARIRSALDSIPEIRPEMVERGRQLLADANYPSQDVVRRIAELITPLPED
jgi:hypothetical protein